MCSLPLIEILQNHFFQLHSWNNHTTIKFQMNSQVDLNMTKASNFTENHRNRKEQTKPYDWILEVAPIQMWMSCYHEIITSVWGLPTLLVISARIIGSCIIKTKQHSLNRQKAHLLFCLETPLLQLFSDTPTSGINSAMKIQ